MEDRILLLYAIGVPAAGLVGAIIAVVAQWL